MQASGAQWYRLVTERGWTCICRIMGWQYDRTKKVSDIVDTVFPTLVYLGKALPGRDRQAQHQDHLCLYNSRGKGGHPCIRKCAHAHRAKPERQPQAGGAFRADIGEYSGSDAAAGDEALRLADAERAPLPGWKGRARGGYG